jgi:hypothetical protein
MNKQLAKITKASLEIQERGTLNFWIHVHYEEGFGFEPKGIQALATNKDASKPVIFADVFKEFPC